MSTASETIKRLRTMGYMPCIEAADEIEQLREHIAALQLVATAHDAEIARLRAALQIVREENDRAKRQFTNVSNKILDEACRALEPKP